MNGEKRFADSIQNSLPQFLGINISDSKKDFYESMYDDVIIPIELCDVYPKAAISKRNYWMVDKSDYVIAFLQYDYGGAYDTVRYASKNGKNIIMIHTPQQES